MTYLQVQGCRFSTSCLIDHFKAPTSLDKSFKRYISVLLTHSNLVLSDTTRFLTCSSILVPIWGTRANQGGRSPQCSPLVERLQRPWWALTELPGESGGKCRGFDPIRDLRVLQLWAELRTSHVHSSYYQEITQIIQQICFSLSCSDQHSV